LVTKSQTSTLAALAIAAGLVYYLAKNGRSPFGIGTTYGKAAGHPLGTELLENKA